MTPMRSRIDFSIILESAYAPALIYPQQSNVFDVHSNSRAMPSAYIQCNPTIADFVEIRCTLHSNRERGMKVRDLIKWIERDGWRMVRTSGSHRQFKHPGKPGTVTIAGHLSDEVHPKTLQSALKQAGLR